MMLWSGLPRGLRLTPSLVVQGIPPGRRKASVQERNIMEEEKDSDIERLPHGEGKTLADEVGVGQTPCTPVTANRVQDKSHL